MAEKKQNHTKKPIPDGTKIPQNNQGTKPSSVEGKTTGEKNGPKPNSSSTIYKGTSD